MFLPKNLIMTNESIHSNIKTNSTLLKLYNEQKFAM